MSKIHSIRRFIAGIFYTLWSFIYPMECDVDGCCFIAVTPENKHLYSGETTEK